MAPCPAPLSLTQLSCEVAQKDWLTLKSACNCQGSPDPPQHTYATDEKLFAELNASPGPASQRSSDGTPSWEYTTDGSDRYANHGGAGVQYGSISPSETDRSDTEFDSNTLSDTDLDQMRDRELATLAQLSAQLDDGVQWAFGSSDDDS